MADQIIPLTSDPNQTMKTTVNVGGRNITLQLDIRYNDIAEYWVMMVTDPVTGTVLIDSVPLITGDYPAGNILGQYAYLGIGSAYVVPAATVAMDYPDDTNLGTDFVLVWSD
jgi:hypothetical protein